jgi:cell division septation protein DedD
VQLRNRTIIGSIVLLALLIIFIPSFFQELSHRPKRFSIPTLPEPPNAVQFNLGLGNVQHSFENPLQFPITPSQAWVLQLSDFKADANANALIQTLRHKGYKAYARQIRTSTGEVIRVFVGPESKLEQIKILAVQLHKDMQLQAMIAHFDPLLSPYVAK